MAKRILVVLSEWGYWGEELIGPLDVLTKAGYQLDFMTPFGQLPALPPSMEEGYLDPPLNKVVTDAHYAKRTTEVHESNLLDNPINLSEKISLMPYFNGNNFGLNRQLSTKDVRISGKSLLTHTMLCFCLEEAGQWQIWSTTRDCIIQSSVMLIVTS